MKRLILLTALFVLAFSVTAWAAPSGTSDTDTVQVTCTIPTFMTVEYSAGTVAFGTLTEADLLAGSATKTGLSDTLKGWANVAASVKSQITTAFAGGWGLQYSDGSTTKTVGTDEHAVTAGTVMTYNVSSWTITGLAWSDSPGADSATVTFTIY